jgi:hypothetical protein
MLKRTPIILSLAVAIFMFFEVTEVMAQAFPPQSCTAGPYTITIDPSAPITVTSMDDPNFAIYQCYSSSGIPCAFPYYVYPYTVDPGNGISRIDELIPVCQFPIDVLATEPQSNQVYNPPNTYDSSMKWPGVLWDNYVLAWTASPTSGKFWVATNTNGLELNTMALKSGKANYYCGIAGPGCGIGGFIPINNMEDKKFGEFQVKITRNRGTWCANTVQYFDPREYLYDGTPNPNHNQWVTLSPESATINDQNLVNCGSVDGNQRCQECIVYGASSPGCYTYTSGGVTYKVPKGCK